MASITINGNQIIVPDNIPLIEACALAKVEIPRFCYHDRLKVAGNCRMCLVEMIIPKSPKPVASCATKVSDGMVVSTNSDMVHSARKGVMQFLLINHPLDCPICDQGGECDLQDQAYFYGKDHSEFSEMKRSVDDKNMGPLVQTHMTRCIHCTRCIRFMDDIAGTSELGVIARGEHMAITTFSGKNLQSELSGNIIDLCPVGALTAKPYASQARSWELQHTNSIDILDAIGSNIRIDSRGLKVVRILPRVNAGINQEWLSDKSRFAHDGLYLQRIDQPYIKKGWQGLEETDFPKAIAKVVDMIGKIPGESIAALAGPLTDLQTAYSLKVLLDHLGSQNYDCRIDGAAISCTSRGNYLFNSTIAGVERATSLLLIGTNPRWEAALINARIFSAVSQNKFSVANIGFHSNLNYKVEQLGHQASVLQDILNGQHEYAKILKDGDRPMIIAGRDAISGSHGNVIAELILRIVEKYKLDQRDDWNGYNLLHKTASSVGALDVGLLPQQKDSNIHSIMDKCKTGEIKMLILTAADDLPDNTDLSNVFVVYIGTHGDKYAQDADVILPAACYTEKCALYANTEGIYQHTMQAVPKIGNAKDDCDIIIDIMKSLSIKTPFRNKEELLLHLDKIIGFSAKYNNCQRASYRVSCDPSMDESYLLKADLQHVQMTATMRNFYMTDCISRASKTMSLCSTQRNL